MIKMFIFFALWFFFGVIIGFKLSSLLRKIEVNFPDEMSEEEIDKMFDEIMERLNEQKRKD